MYFVDSNTRKIIGGINIMYFVDFNKMKVIEETSAKPTDLKLINLKLTYHKHLLHENYETVKNAIASYLDENQTQIEKTDKVFFSITLSGQSDLNSDEFVSAVNVINAAIFEYMRLGDGNVARKREHRLNAPDNLIHGVHASVGLIKKACNYELKSDIFNIVINHLTKHDGGPETYLQYLLVDGKEDK